jgi:hypothetical protein
VIGFTASYPDHYSIIFLMRHYDPTVNSERERLGQEFIAGIHAIVRAILPTKNKAKHCGRYKAAVDAELPAPLRSECSVG